MAAETVRENLTRHLPLPERVAAEPQSTDARQRFARAPNGELRITGTSAEASDGAGAELSLSFDDRRVAIGVKPGQSPEQSALLLARVLPSGYRLSIATRRGEEVTFELLREVRQQAARVEAPKTLPRTSTPLATAVAQPVAPR